MRDQLAEWRHAVLKRHRLRLIPLKRTMETMSEPIVDREDLQAAIEARKELGSDLEPAVIDAFVERIAQRIAQRGLPGQSEEALRRRRNHQKEMVLGSMSLSIPMLVVAGIFTGLAGVLAVCAALVVIAVVSAR
jgi:hypothetical protein